MVPSKASLTSGPIPVTYRVAGDSFLLIEYGELTLDLRLRFRAHAVMTQLESAPPEGIIDMTPGIRSLQVHYDPDVVSLSALVAHLKTVEGALDSEASVRAVPSRIVHLPLSWGDEACQEAVEKYDKVVRKDAPWYPSNLEFIRRINGLNSIDDVKRIVFEASYLVMCLGDVYLGAPVATPVDPRHRLVTTKYNPARTWTAENSVGIGGAYLCVYGMEGPGGYQFVGRTLQMWNRYRSTECFEKPWLLRFFDQIRFHEVSHDELMQLRKDFPLGRYPIQIEHTEFSLDDYEAMLQSHRNDISAFQSTRENAFNKELTQWRESGQFNPSPAEPEIPDTESDWPEDCVLVESPVSGSVWQSLVSADESVKQGQTLIILESMKMEIEISAPADLSVHRVVLEPGQRVVAGQVLLVMNKQ